MGRFRNGVVVGFAAGYYLGARAGREPYRQIRQLTGRLRQAPDHEPRSAEHDPEREIVALDALHPELYSRVMAATAHAPVRVVERHHGPTTAEYEVFALAGDRFVHMLLALRPDGSVEETTVTALRDQIEVVATGSDRATVRTPSDIIAVPLDIASAISKTDVET